MSAWPDSDDFTRTIQNPHLCFVDPDLRQCLVERNPHSGMPMVWSGSFAQVYLLRHSSHRWATKCFTRAIPDIKRRYEAISQALSKAKLRSFVGFRLLDDEMRVNAARYPVVKMDWVSGQTLDKFVPAHLHDPHQLLTLAKELIEAVQSMEANQIAHGDLQHRNVLVTAHGLRLVDYDGLFVPAFAGQQAPELGLPSYQHPRRSGRDYGVGLDRFSLLVLCTALVALATDPTLWTTFQNPDCLLFSELDFIEPSRSRLLNRLAGSTNVHVRRLTERLIDGCHISPMKVEIVDLSVLPTGPVALRQGLVPARSKFNLRPQPAAPSKIWPHGRGVRGGPAVPSAMQACA